MDSSAFDFKARARSLLKTLSLGVPGAANALNSALSIAAVETALREVYAEGQQAKRSGAAASRPVSARPVEPRTAAVAAPAPECEHEWEEAFIDGRALGFRCVECGVLQSEVQNRCTHYFVDTGAGEVCVACRKPKKARRA